MGEMSPDFVRHNLRFWRNSEMDRDVDLCWCLGNGQWCGQMKLRNEQRCGSSWCLGNEQWCGQMVMRMSKRHILITSLNAHRDILNGAGDCAWTGNEKFHSPQTATAVSAKCPTSQPQRLAVSTWHVTILRLPASAKAIILRFTEHLI